MRRGVRRKKSEDTEENEDSFDAEDSPSSPSLVKTNVEKGENDIVSSERKSSTKKQNTPSDDSLQMETSPSLLSSIIKRSITSPKLLNDLVETSHEITETEGSIEVDLKNERTINIECGNEHSDNHGEKESFEKAESMEVDEKIQVVDSSNTNLLKEIESSEIKTKKIKEPSAKLASHGDTVKKTEVEEPSSSKVSNSKMNIEESKLEVELVKGPLALKNEEGSSTIENVSSNDEIKNSVIDNLVEIEKVNVEEMCDTHNQIKNIIEKTSTETFSILSIDNQKDSADIEMVSIEEGKIAKEDSPTKFSGESLSENTLVSEDKIENFETVNENNLLTPSGNEAQKELPSSIKLCEESDTSVADTPAVFSDGISAEVCDKIESSALYKIESSALYSSSPAKNNNLPISEENIKNEKPLKKKYSDSSDILLIDITEDEISEKDTSSNPITKCVRRKSLCSEIDSAKVSDLQIVVPEKENVEKMNTVDNISEKESTRIPSNFENDVPEKMETSLEPVTISKTLNTQEVNSESDLVNDEAIKLDSPSKSSEISQNEVTDIEIKTTKNEEEESESYEMTFKSKKGQVKPNKEPTVEIKVFKSQIDDGNEKPAIPFTSVKSELGKNTNPAVTSNTIDKNAEPTAASKTKVYKNVKPAATSEIVGENGKYASVSKTESMEIDNKIQMVDNSFASLIEENIESSEKKTTKKFKECRVRLVPLEYTLKKIDFEKYVANTKVADKTGKPETSKAKVNKKEKLARTSKSKVNKNAKPAATSKRGVDNEKSASDPFNTEFLEIQLVDNSSTSLIEEIIESSEKITKKVDEVDSNTKPTISKIEVSKNEKQSKTEKAKDKKSVAAFKTDKSEKPELPSKAESDKREMPVPPSKTEAESNSQKNKIPGRGFIIGTKDVSEDGKKTLFDCVLCFSGEEKYGVRGGILNKHIKTKEHALKVMEIENKSLYKQFKDDSSAKSEDVINAILEYEETLKKQTLVVASQQTYASQRKILLKKIEFLKRSDAKADNTVKVNHQKRTLNTELVETVPAEVPVALNTLSFLSSLKKKDKENEKQPKKEVPVALNTLSFLSSLNKKDDEKEKQPKNEVPIALNTLGFLSSLKKDKENEIKPESKVPVALNTLSFLSSLNKKDNEKEKQPKTEVPVALNTLGFLSSIKKKDNENVKQLKEDLKKPAGKYSSETLSQHLAEEQIGRYPDKIVLVMDDRDVFLCSEKLGDFVRVIRKRDLDFAKAVDLVKSDIWFGKGTLFLFLGGVFSSIKVRKHSACAQNKCEIPVHVYHIEEDTPANIIIDEALQLNKVIIDNTTNDQAFFCDLVPVNVDNHNVLKLDKRLCYRAHPIDFHKKVPIQFMGQYTNAINEFNRFVKKHTEMLGFKFESLVKGTFGRYIIDVKFALGNLSTDGVTLNQGDYKRRCSSILSKVEAIRKQLHCEVSKIDTRTGKKKERTSEKSNGQFDKVAIIANRYYKETLTHFSSDKVVVYADEDLKLEGIEQLILEKKKSLPEKTLWLTLIGSFCISEIKYLDACQAKISCKDPLITLVPSPEVQNPSSLPETIRKIKNSTLALLKKVRSLIGPKSMFFIIPPYPPTIVSEQSFSHSDLHSLKCPDTQLYFASEGVISQLSLAFTKLSKEMISLVMHEFQSHKLSYSSVKSYGKSLPYLHLEIVRHKADCKSSLFIKWQDFVKGMISEYLDWSLKEIPVPVRIPKRFDHFVFIGTHDLLNQLSDRLGAECSTFNINYPINFELPSMKAVSNKRILFVIACDLTLIAKDVLDAKCNTLKCTNMMSYFISDPKDIETLITDKLLDIKKLILKIKNIYPVNATVIIAPLFSRYCVERSTVYNDTVHRTLHFILKNNSPPCVMEAPKKYWENAISLLQYYFRDEVLSNLYGRNDHEPLTDVIESFLSSGSPSIQWIKPVVTPTEYKFKYNIKILFDKLRNLAYTKELKDTVKTKSSVTETAKRGSTNAVTSNNNKKTIPIVNSTGKSTTTGKAVSTIKDSYVTSTYTKDSNGTARTTNQPFNATASQNISTHYQDTQNTTTNYQTFQNASTNYQTNQNASSNYHTYQNASTNYQTNQTASTNYQTNLNASANYHSTTPYTYDTMSGSYNTYGNGMNQEFYPSNSSSYYFSNQPTPPQQMPSVGMIQQPPPLAQVPPPLGQFPPPLSQVPPPLAQIPPPPVYPYQFPLPQQEVTQQQNSTTANSSYSNTFNNLSANYTQSHIAQPSISDMLSSSVSQIASPSTVQPVSGSKDVSNASKNVHHSTTVIRSVVKNIIIEKPKELVDFLSEFGINTWRMQPAEHAFVIGKKELIEPLSSQDLKNVRFIYQNLDSVDEGQVSFLIKKMETIPQRSLCFLAFDISAILKTTLISPGCQKFKCKQPVSGSCLKTQSHLSQQMNIITKVKDIVNLATKIAGSIRVVVLPVFPSKVFVDDSSSLAYHKISHALNDSNSYILIGERIEWEDCITTFLQTWNNFMKVHHDKYTYPKAIPKYPYLKDTIPIRDKVEEFFDDDNQIVIWENAVTKIIKIMMSYTEETNIERTITITKTEETTIDSKPTSSTDADTSTETVVKVWNFSDAIPEKFFDFLFKAIDPKAKLDKIVENDECYYQVKLTKVSAILITRKLDNILIGDSTLRVSLITNEDYPELSSAQEKYILSIFQEAYSQFKSQIIRNIRNKLLNVIDFTNYKTTKCKGNCYGDSTNCNLYHSSNDRRRNPLRYTYMHKMCTSSGECAEGDSCSSAHNVYEQMFYPTIFQTILCPLHANNVPITNGFCKFAHKNSPELFFTGSWQDIVTFGSQNSLHFLVGAIRAIHKLALRTDVKICFIAQSEEFLETVFKIIDDIAFQQYTLKCVNLEKIRYNANAYDVYFGKLSTIYNYSGKILSINDYGVLIVDNIKAIMEDPMDAEYLLKICQRLKISAGLRSPINKVFVSSSYDQGVTGVVSRFLGIPLQEVKGSDIHPEPKLTNEISEIDTISTYDESIKDIMVISSRSRSHSRSRTSRSRRSISRSHSRRSGSRSRKRRYRSRSLKRRSRSRSRSWNKRKSKSRSVTKSRRRSSSRSRQSWSKSMSHKISPKRRHSPSPQSFKAKKRQASPKSSPQMPKMPKLDDLSRKVSQKLFSPHETFQSSSKMSLGVEKNVSSVKTSGEEMYQKFLTEKASLRNTIEEEFNAYKAFPELHPNYEMHYEEFLSNYHKQYGTNTNEDHTEGFWIMFWARKVKELKEAELDRRTKDLEKKLFSKAQPKNVEKTKGSAPQKATSASLDTFSVENTLKLLEELSPALGMLGPAIVAIINSVRESGPTTSKGLSVIIDKENLVLIKLVIEKMNSLQKTCSSSQLPKLIKGVEWTQKLIEHAKNPPKEQGLNLMAIAKASVGKDPGFTLNLIKTALAYEGMQSMGKEEINQLFLKVCSIHFEMSIQDQ